MKKTTITEIKEHIILKLKKGDWSKDTNVDTIVEEIQKLFPNVIGETEQLKKVINETLNDVKQKGTDITLSHVAVEKQQSKKNNMIKQTQGNTRPTQNVEHLKTKISPVGVFKVSPKFNPNSSFMDSGVIKNYYNEMIGKKVLGKDKQLLNDIIKYRKEILQYRTFCNVGLYSKGSLIASVEVHGVLIEQGINMVNWWHGKTLDYFEPLVRQFENYMQQFGIRNVTTTKVPNKVYKVDDVGTDFNFA